MCSNLALCAFRAIDSIPRTESVNFIHDVNVLRKTLKSVYGGSADLQALNSEIDKLPKNCRVQGNFPRSHPKRHLRNVRC
jgi:hypothetical protein